MSDSRKDLPSVNANNFQSRVRETLQGYLGTNGNVLDRGVTVRDLTDAGIVRVNPTYLSGGAGSPIIGAGPAVGTGGGTTTTIVVPGGGSTPPPYVPDLTKPPAPTGFFVGAGLTNLQGGITAPAYTAGHGHDRSIIYGTTYSGSGPLPTFNDTAELTRFTGSIFAYPSTTATTWHLWVTHLSKDGVESDPTGGLNGLSVSTGQDIPLILAALSGQIGYTELSEDFTTAFDTVATVAGEAQGTANDAQNAATWLGNRYTVRTTASVDGKTLVGGFGLAGTSSATQGTSIDFGVSADRFWIGAPQEAGVTAVPSVKPFIVQTTDTAINGVTVPKGVYMDAAFIVNLEAAVARLGTAWIGTAMIGNAQVVDAHVASLNAEKITAGLLDAERIDGRGLTIKNALGDTLLDASGDSVPPWVVQVLSSADPGSVPLTLMVDAQNRARIRSISVDNASLKAKISPSGYTIQLSTPSTTVYSATYGASTLLLPDEYRELDYTRFTMEAGTYYNFTFSPLCARAGVDTTVEFFVVLPLGAQGYLPDGGVLDMPAQFYKIGSRSATAANPSPSVVPAFSFYVRSGPASGAIKFYAKAPSEFYMLEWTRYAVNRLNEVVYPASSVVRTGTVLDFATNITSTPGFSTTGMPGAYDALWTVNTSRPMNSMSTHLFLWTSSFQVYYDPSTGRVQALFQFWSGAAQAGSSTHSPIILSPMVGSSAPFTYVYGSTTRQTNGLHGTYFAYDLAELPVGERARWYSNVRFTALTSAQPDGYNPFAPSSGFDRSPINSGRPPFPEDVPIPPNYVDGRAELDDGALVDAAFSVGHRDTSSTSYIEFEYFLDYLGEQVGPKRTVRIVINYTA